MLCRRLAFAFLSLLACSGEAGAVLLFGNQSNTTDPGTGVPWNNVGAIGTNNASAVYLGNQYVLTANHVWLQDFNQVPSPYFAVTFNGISYSQDTSFGFIQIGTADLKIIRITSAPPSPVTSTQLAGILDNESLPGVLIGYGKGKGAPIIGGWAWETDASWAAHFVKRWGVNQNIGALTDSGIDYLYDAFDNNGDANEAAFGLGDSGSGFFVSYSGGWKLVGVPAGVTTFGQAQYDNDAATPGDQPDKDFMVRVSHYSWQLRFRNWAEYFLGVSSPAVTTDADADGLPLLLEYAFGGTPTGDDHALAPQFSTDGTNASLTYYQRMSATDLTFTLQQSADLSAWTDVVSPTQQTLSSSGTVWQIKSSVPLSGATKIYLRLKVTLSP